MSWNKCTCIPNSLFNNLTCPVHGEHFDGPFEMIAKQEEKVSREQATKNILSRTYGHAIDRKEFEKLMGCDLNVNAVARAIWDALEHNGYKIVKE